MQPLSPTHLDRQYLDKVSEHPEEVDEQQYGMADVVFAAESEFLDDQLSVVDYEATHYEEPEIQFYVVNEA